MIVGLRYVFLLVVTACICVGQQASDFDGSWLMKYNGQPILKLTLLAAKGTITGSLTEPKGLAIDQDGDVTAIGPVQVTHPVQKAVLQNGHLEVTIDDDSAVLAIENQDRLTLTVRGMRPWRMERAINPAGVMLATHLVEPDYQPDVRALRERLHAMVTEDQKVRMAFDDTQMEEVDAKNRPEVLRIFDRYGWVTKSLAGKQAANDFWLLVQHQPVEIQQRLMPALERAARAGDASMSNYAYLFDRVEMDLGRPQRFGTQVKCEGGRPVLYTVDDAAGLESRRKELYLQPIPEYLQMDYLVKLCARQK